MNGANKCIISRGSYHYWDFWRSALQWRQNECNGVSNVCSGADQGTHQSYSSLPFVRGIHRRPVNSPHKGPTSNAENVSIWCRQFWDGNMRRFHAIQPVVCVLIDIAGSNGDNGAKRILQTVLSGCDVIFIYSLAITCPIMTQSSTWIASNCLYLNARYHSKNWNVCH